MELKIITSELTKGQVKSYAKLQAQEAIEQGLENPLEVFIQIKRIEDFLEEYKENLKESVKKEIERYGKEGASISNAKAILRSGATRLDYSSDGVYKDLEDALKNRKELLDLATKSKDVIFDKNGEEIPKCPVKSNAAESIVITY